jgi:hypothetical protein
MPWTESGLYAATLNTVLTQVNAINWTTAANLKFYLTNNSDAPNYHAALASNVYAATNEVSGTGWAATGIAASALAAGSTSIAPAMTVTGPTPSAANWTASNISVAGTTLSSIYGGYFYASTFTNYLIIGIYFGGTSYGTVAGTFAVTWSGGVIATISCATT